MTNTAARACAVVLLTGNPDQLLTEDWRPEIPGINAPGSYLTDYGTDPWRTVKSVIDQVIAGSYPHFFPSASGRTGARTSEP